MYQAIWKERGVTYDTEEKNKQKGRNAADQIEALLSDVLVECSAVEKSVEKNVREIVLSARKSIGSAIDFIGAATAPAVQPKVVRRAKAPAKAKNAQSHTSPENVRWRVV